MGTNDNAAENLGSHNKKPEDNDAAYDGLDVAEGTDNEKDIQNQLLLDQDLSDSDDDFEDEEIDNVSYEDGDEIEDMANESSVSDENQDQDDAELIQMNLLQDQDISDDEDDE